MKVLIHVQRIAAFGVVTAALGGCFTYTPAQPLRGRDRELAGPALSLPPRDVAPLEALRQRTPDRLFRWKLSSDALPESERSDTVRKQVEEPRYTLTVNEVLEGTLVRMFEQEDNPVAWLFSPFQPNGRVVTLRHVDPGQWAVAQGRAARNRESLNRLRVKDGVVADPTVDEVGIETGIEFRIPSEAPSRCRGVVLHLWALASNPYEHRVMETVSKAGWLVVDMKPGTNVAPRVSLADAERITALEAERWALMSEYPKQVDGESTSKFQKRLMESQAYQRQLAIGREVMALSNPPLSVCTLEEVESAGAQLAARIDEVLADHACAARAVVELTRRMHPGVEGLPCIVMGFSAGALSTPTVAVAVQADAAVIIGGASNAVGVALESELSQGGVRVACGSAPPSREVVDALSAAYLRHSRLDAFHTAPMLAGVPVLVVDAGWDTWVPARFGDQLYERLGRPDRLHMSLGGHGMLFYFLPGQAMWIERWMREKAESPTRQTP